MRIAQLHLLAFGPFRDVVLDFSAPGLHVVFGPNEAGKSTTLRAITNLLFGIEASTPDAHLHKPSDLRVGGVLVADDGARISVVRRKSTSKAGPKSLLDANGEPTSDEPLLRMLRGTTEETFRRAFAIHPTTLAAGAKALLSGQGDLGESLFDASVGGGADVQELLAELEGEAGAIYRPQGRTLPLNDALKAFDEAKKRIKATQTLPDDYSAKRRAIEDTEALLSKAREARKDLVSQRDRIERAQQRAPLESDRERLTHLLAELGDVAKEPARVRSLPAQLQAYERAKSELAACGLELEGLRRAIQEAARRASVDASSGAARLDARTEARIRRRVTERTALAQKIASAKGELARDERELSRRMASSPAEASSLAVDATALVEALSAAREAGDLDARHTEESVKLSRKRDELERSVASLGRFEGTAIELERLAVPAKEAVEDLARRAAELDRTLARRTERLDGLRHDVLATERRIAELEGEFAPPSPDDLQNARIARDRAWEALRASDEATRAKLAAGFERTMLSVDAVVDRMLGDAQRVASLASLRSAKDALERQAASLADEVEETTRLRARCDEEHAALWVPSRVAPSGFAEMASWLDRRARILEGLAAVRDAEHALEDLAARGASLRQRLGAALVASGAQRPASDTLSDCVRAAEARREQIERERRAARETEEAVAKLAGAVEERRAALAEDARDLAATNEELARLVAPFGVASDASADEIDAFLRAAGELASLEEKKAAVEARTSRLAEEVRAFEAHVSRLVSELAPSLGDLRTEDAASELADRAQKAEPWIYERRAVEARLEELGHAPVPDDLAAVVAHPEDASRKLSELAASIAAREAEIEELQQRLGGLRAELDAIHARSGAEDAALQAEEALAKVRAYVERYARAKLASTLLTREIARFREEHQGPLLATTSKIFHCLTRGAFLGVRAGFDDKDRPSLVCVRDGGREVDVNGLSEGTRDQLYLALRLSTILRNAEIRGPLPFVLDDLFVNFDDERAAAGLDVLAEVAARMQVLFFTHHAHLVELARRTVPAASLHVHVLPSRADQARHDEVRPDQAPTSQALHEAPRSSADDPAPTTRTASASRAS